MKRFLAILLVLMVPAAAFAETWILDASIGVKDWVEGYIAEMLFASEEYNDADVPAIASAYTKLIDGLGVTLTIQEDAAALAVKLCGGELMDIVCHVDGEDVYLTSSMLPEYAFKESLPVPSVEEAVLSDLFASTDWMALLSNVSVACTAWADGIESIESRGVFTGDAYDGGTHCTTFALTDKDVSALVSGVATEEVRAVVTAVMEAADADAAELFRQFDALNELVASENAYLYLLRVVTNDNGEFVGASLSVMDSYRQLATLSFGLTEEEATLVLGLGANEEQNYWCEVSAAFEKFKSVTKVNGTIKEWRGGKDDAFSYVKATRSPEYAWSWKCNVSQMGKRFLWNGEISEGIDSYNWTVTTKGDLDMNTGAFSVDIFGDVMLHLSLQPSEQSIPALGDSLTICSFSSVDAQQQERLFNQLQANVMARLLKLIPTQVLVTFMRISQ